MSQVERAIDLDNADLPEARPGESFEEFFEATYERLLRTLFLVAGNRQEAEDAAQEAFVRVYERWESVRGRPNPAGYTYRVALNVHRSRLRRVRAAARRVWIDSQPDEITAADDRDEVDRALAKLPRGHREALVLVEWLGMSDEEAGRVLGVAPVTVRVRLSRARQRMRTEMTGGEE
jgi:RNA polymerase sigma-70 factor (ECF subfamily)